MDNPPTPAPAPKNNIHSDQDQHLADEIVECVEVLTNAQTEPELVTLLSDCGYTAEKIAAGLALWQTAQTAYRTRQEAIGAQKQARGACAEAEEAARSAYMNFRGIARSVLTDDASRTALQLDGRVPSDHQKFVALARAGYETALNTPAYLSQLAEYGFGQAKLTAANLLLDAFVAADNAQQNAEGAAQRATQARDEAVDAAEKWHKQFRGIAKVTTRGRPDLAQKLRL